MKTIRQETRGCLWFFIISLAISGLTAIPLETELDMVSRLFPLDSKIGAWIDRVYQGVYDTNQRYPFMAYGYDWLAFAHFVMAILFIGPLKDPVRNKWVIEFGLLACILIIPFALIAGHFRGIPLWWRFIDASFGIIGLLPLFICLGKIRRTESLHQKTMDDQNA